MRSKGGDNEPIVLLLKDINLHLAAMEGKAVRILRIIECLTLQPYLPLLIVPYMSFPVSDRAAPSNPLTQAQPSVCREFALARFYLAETWLAAVWSQERESYFQPRVAAMVATCFDRWTVS